MAAYEKVSLARHKDRAGTTDYIGKIFTHFVELHGDRRFCDDKAVTGGIALLFDIPVTVVGIERGKDLSERVKKNFGCAHPEGYRKAIRLFKQAEKFGRPVICFVDTPGAYPGIGAEERGQGQAIAESITEMLSLKVPTVSIITGEGGSGGALALAAADEVWMLENAIYSVISPEGCASILWKDATKAKEAAECLKLTAQDLYSFGVVDRVFSEDKDFDALCEEIKGALLEAVREKAALPKEELLDRRYQKFRRIGREFL
ncbi:MAG: acetyl-CoA carboxylase carboxyltransferase subunit alpha [Clostridiales bacterium]|jgi:acetyl-CoA carboxylase carboxyl transferase subunit alpha|nr:acetyl-CoA carboxylase carboxyltransferase subunit alpha [Clostridiales bacterium]